MREREREREKERERERERELSTFKEKVILSRMRLRETFKTLISVLWKRGSS